MASKRRHQMKKNVFAICLTILVHVYDWSEEELKIYFILLYFFWISLISIKRRIVHSGHVNYPSNMTLINGCSELLILLLHPANNPPENRFFIMNIKKML